MILGEHAVLHGRRAVVGAIDRRIGVSIRRRTDRTIDIRSPLGRWTGEIDDADPSGRFRFVLAALTSLREAAATGLEVEITSNLPPTVGLGSSAAVTVAALAAAHGLAGRAIRPDALHAGAMDVIRGVQGLGSGADAAAAVFGGILRYQTDPVIVHALHTSFDATLVYSGAKTPTPEAVRVVESRRRGDPDRFERIFDRIDGSIDDAVKAIEADDRQALGGILNRNHEHMVEMGVSNEALDDIISRLREEPGVHGAKISGSGLGDCVLAIGSFDAAGWPYECIPISFAAEGVRIDEAGHC